MPDWAETLLDALGGCLEMYSPGSMKIRYSEVEDQLLVAPALVEIVGGAEDGEAVYPFFSLQIKALIEVFDETPEISWQTMDDEVWLEGNIDGEAAFLTIRRSPFEDSDEATQVLDEDGVLRSKRQPDDE